MTDAELIVARLRALVRERPDSEVPLIPLEELAHIPGAGERNNGGSTMNTDPVMQAKARALGALRKGDLETAREAVTDARCQGASRVEIACLFNIDWEQPDSVLQREIARVLTGQRAVR